MSDLAGILVSTIMVVVFTLRAITIERNGSQQVRQHHRTGR